MSDVSKGSDVSSIDCETAKRYMQTAFSLVGNEELSSEQDQALLAHIRDCPECKKQFDDGYARMTTEAGRIQGLGDTPDEQYETWVRRSLF